MLDESLQCWKGSGYKILLKHHPRFNDAIDLADAYRKFPFAEETSLPIERLAPYVRLHITYSSTTCFEYASCGIPTCFLCDERFALACDIFYDQTPIRFTKTGPCGRLRHTSPMPKPIGRTVAR